MELNKIYKQSEYPIEDLSPGTIIKGIRYNHKNDAEQDVIIISERYGEWEEQRIIGVCCNTGEFYTHTHCLLTYKILKLTN